MNNYKHKGMLVAGGIFVVLAVSVAVVAVFLFVVDNDENNNTSIKEYAELCGGVRYTSQDLFSTPGITYKEVVEALEPAIQEYVDLSPPAQLQELHNLSAEQNAEFLRYLKEQDVDAFLSAEDPWIEEFASYLLIKGPQAKVAFDKLPQPVQQELQSSGCIEEI